MNILLRWAGAIALALFPAAALAQQHATTSAAPAGFAPEYAPVTVAATSTPTTGTTSTATTVTFTPQLGRPVRLITKLTAGSSYSAQVFTSPDACTTLNQITVAGQVWASFTAATGTINEDVDVPMISGISYCLTVTPSAGATVSYAVRQ